MRVEGAPEVPVDGVRVEVRPPVAAPLRLFRETTGYERQGAYIPHLPSVIHG